MTRTQALPVLGVSPIFKFLLRVPDDRAKPIIDDNRARALGNQLDFAIGELPLLQAEIGIWADKINA